jgi:hypothetical protein
VAPVAAQASAKAGYLPRRRWILPVAAYLQAALGSIVATGCDLRSLVLFLPVHLTFALALGGGLLLRQIPGRSAAVLGWATVGIGSLIVLEKNLVLGVFYVCAVLFCFLESNYSLVQRRARELRVLGWSLGYGVLPFLGGYVATGHRPGASALLLGLGFLTISAGTFPLLNPGPPRARNDELVRGLKAPTAVGLVLVGLSAVIVWLWIYGSGFSGVALSAPGVLWILWLMTDRGTSSSAHRLDARQRGQAMTAWIGLLVAIALASYF